MLEELKQRVMEANKRLKSDHLVISTWGNVSEYDEKTGLVAIKASGVSYDSMKPEHMLSLIHILQTLLKQQATSK